MPHIPLVPALRRVLGRLGQPPAGDRSDGQLLDQFCNGDGSAFAALVERHGPMVLGVCQRVLQHPQDAEDAFQATFLVLARKAGALDRGRSLASWLYTVAHRLALNARLAAARRRAHESKVPAMTSRDADGETTWQDVRQVLDAELGQLPEKYRGPLVLCYLQGKTNQEAARELGWPAGTMSRRLERARELLRERLSRRGLVLPSALLVSFLVERTAPALAPSLAQATTAASLAIAGGSAQGSAGALAEEMLRQSAYARVRSGLVALFLIAVFGSGVGLALHLAAPAEVPENMIPEDARAAEASPEPTPVRSMPFPEADWTVSSLPEKANHREWVNSFLEKDLAGLAREKRIVLPGAFPELSDGRVIFRTSDGFALYNTLETEPNYRHMWQSGDGGAQAVLGSPGSRVLLTRLRDNLAEKGPYGLFVGNTMNGTVSTDGVRAFLVDDLILPPNDFASLAPVEKPNLFDPKAMAEAARNYASIRPLLYSNRLNVYNLDSFKLITTLGGRTPCGNAELDRLFGLLDENGKPRTDDYRLSYFLGPPLARAGKVYLLHEDCRKLRLVCLEMRDTGMDKVPPPPNLIWARQIATASIPLAEDVGRRSSAARLVSDGRLVLCPTHAGSLIAVDMKSGEIAWSHQYRKGAAPDLLTGWRPTAPVLQDGKVVFTAPDDGPIRCLDLRDGKLLWKADRADDLYLAGVFRGKVVLAGKDGCRALRLSDGAPLWSSPVGTPSGHGTGIGDVAYLLPLRMSTLPGGPGIAVIHLESGRVVGHLPSPLDPETKLPTIPGNLLLHEGGLVSQDLTGVRAYRNWKMRDILADIPLGPAELEGLWSSLGASDATFAGIVGSVLAAKPAATVPFLRGKLKPIPHERERIERAVTALASPDFNTRRKAGEDLERLGELAEPNLRAVLENKPDLDLSTRIRDLLAKVDRARQSPSPEEQRVARVILALERSASPEAVKLLQDLAAGAPGASQTRAAQAALGRLSEKASVP